MKKILQSRFLFFLLGIFLVATFAVVKATPTNKMAGDPLTASEWNASVVPTGAVMAFNLNSCPNGWVPADGSGTPGDFANLDLRGVFLRGLNDFGTGVRADGKQDPDGAARTLGDYQSDEFKSHTHSGAVRVGSGGTGVSGSAVSYGSIGHTGGSETRSKNVSLIYCVKN